VAPRKKTAPVGPIQVDSIVHADKRANLPTADAYEFVSPEVDAPLVMRYPRDTSLDPQLVWKGKDTQDGADLSVEAPPIYIQEKIDPRALVEDLIRSKGRPEGSQLNLFAAFDGLDELDLVDFYRHDANWSNRMILGDSLQVMASLSEREALRGKVQMIYIDPPYGIKFGSNWQSSTRKRDVKDGKLEDASREVEQIKAFRDTWELGIHSYLAYLRDRLQVARDLLTESGSVFVQIGDENVHLVRCVMDEVFGSENFISDIVLKTTSGAGSPSGGTLTLAGVHDYVVWYARNLVRVKYRQIYGAKTADEGGGGLYRRVRDADGRERPATPEEIRDPNRLPIGAKLFRPDNLTSQSSPESAQFKVDLEGRQIGPGKGGWKTNPTGMERLRIANRLFVTRNGTLQYVRFLDDFSAYPLNNVWTDVGTGSFTEDKVYIVQTNTKIVQRCMLMTTDPGDLVLDPTCGSGTTAYVAEQWGRRWITVDTSRVALALARQRIMGARFAYYLLADSDAGRRKEEELTGQRLAPAVPTDDIRHGFVYERVQHITLKSIANNPDITEGMTRDQIDAAIRHHAEFEMLYDKPYEDNKRVRVAGPFTAESLSPHRSLAFGGSDEPASVREAALDPTAPTFEQTVLANLEKAGIQNGKRKERLTFDSVEPYAGVHIQAVGSREDAPDGSPSVVGLSIGPQYGTVGPKFIKEAALEAIRATDIDLLCVLGMAFDPAALGVTGELNATDEGFASVAAERQLGRVPVLLVRMNADLVMGEELKKTGAGNLFTVFGEPDIELSEVEGGEWVVTVHGVDVYDPTTGEVRSDSTDKIALWMIDTDYNEESFFVRHCYFTGGQDPYARLKVALKAEVDEDAWESLYRTRSRPFPRPETNKIAVKVINDYGDEVMKVFTL
jgi:adenine-specific DNA-methyltransferase